MHALAAMTRVKAKTQTLHIAAHVVEEDMRPVEERRREKAHKGQKLKQGGSVAETAPSAQRERERERERERKRERE